MKKYVNKMINYIKNKTKFKYLGRFYYFYYYDDNDIFFSKHVSQRFGRR